MLKTLLKSALQNIAPILVGFFVAFLGTKLDLLLNLYPFHSSLAKSIGLLLVPFGYLLRVWATYYFYKNRLRVVVLKAQSKLITEGPFRFSRNPLYLGGNIFIFFGASLVLGTPMGIVITIAHIPLMNCMIAREERQLEQRFGKKWLTYKKHVRRWI